jgi:hypothetical protein
MQPIIIPLDGCLEIYPIGINLRDTIECAKRYTKGLMEIVKPNHVINVFSRGSSGAYLASLTIMGLIGYGYNPDNIKLIHIKKEGETSHSNHESRLFDDEDYNVIIDDFIASGDTINAIYHRMKLTGKVKNTVLIVSRADKGSIIDFIPSYLIIGVTLDRNNLSYLPNIENKPVNN